MAESSRGARPRRDAQSYGTNPPETRAALKEVAGQSRSVFLSFWLAPKRSFLWIVSGTGVRRVDLPPAGDIEAAVRDYRAMLDNSTMDPLARSATPGDRLYAMLIAPAALPKDASVVIVPDGALHGLNFETLPVDGRERHYFIEDAEIQVAPSLAMLGTSARPKRPDRSLLLIGNPTPREPEFPALSYAPVEMTSRQALPAGQGDGVRRRPGDAGGLPRRRVGSVSMIHFTAHATANVESPLDSAVVLSGPDTGYKLYARDVADKPLNADLVTVSACRGAGERAYSGEGLVGSPGLSCAPARAKVIAGLWDVDDGSTARLMGSAGRQHPGRHEPAAALREAKLLLNKDGGQLARPVLLGAVPALHGCP